jgi:hypothetical protein
MLKLGLLLGVVAGMQQAPAGPPAAEKVDVCAVIRSPHAFFGHYLELSGTVIGAAPDKLSLVSPKCQGGIPLGFSAEVLGHEDVKTLLGAMRTEKPGTISGDFEGGLIFTEQGTILRLQVDRVDRMGFPKR